ncbi:hypothetical protein ES703_57413 [subsurface metagenome]
MPLGSVATTEAPEIGLLFDSSRIETATLAFSSCKSDKERILVFTVRSNVLLPPSQEKEIGTLTISSPDCGVTLGSKTAT